MSSVGNLTSLSYIKKNGDNLVVTCLLVLYENNMGATYLSHSSRCYAATLDKASINVLLKRFTRPFVWEWYRVELNVQF